MRSFTIVLALVACQAASSDERQRDTGVRQQGELAIRFHMYRNFDLARAIERLVIRGDLEPARALARSLASAAEVPGAEGFGRDTRLVRERAAALAEAPGIDEACRRVAGVLEACAACHANTQAVVRFDTYPAPPPDRPTLDARMARHRWAIDRVWEGVVGSADKPWSAGLAVLSATPPPFSPLDRDRAGFAVRLQQLAVRGGEQRIGAPAERTRLYGELLVTCAACHSGRTGTPR